MFLSCVGVGVGVGMGTFYVVPLIGFTAAGIASGSLASQMMSAFAIANGGGVPAGGLIAILQSIGATGAVGLLPAGLAGAGAMSVCLAIVNGGAK